MEPSEIEFLAEETVVTIVPNFNCRKTYLITGELGPFRAGIPIKVPMWLATDLKRRQKCRIVPPDWMDLELLEKLLDEELESSRFVKMPTEHFMVEAKTILGLGMEDNMNNPMPVRSVIKDIWDRRMAKLATSVIDFMQLGGDFVKVPNLTPLEINLIKPILCEAVDFLSRAEEKEDNFVFASSQDNENLESREENPILNYLDCFPLSM